MSKQETANREQAEPLLVKPDVKNGDDVTQKPTATAPVKRNKSVVLLEHKRQNEKKMDKWQLVPPDGGWGWLVLFGATMVNILMPGMIKSFGVLLVEFEEAFHAKPSESMWIPSLCYFLYSSLGPISSILSVALSYRIVTIIGGICSASGMILSFWASSVYFLYFTYGILVGCGAGLAFPPTVYIVCSYFVRLRGVANGICISGSAFGSILIPPLLRIILVTYGYRGACLIMGGITLNVFVAALFYDRVEKHMKQIPIESNEEDNDVAQAKFIISQEGSIPSLHIPHNDSFLEHIESSENNFNRSVSSAAVQSLKSLQRERKISMPTGKQEVMKFRAGHNTSSSTLHAVPEKQNGNQVSDVNVQSRQSVRRRPGATPRRSTSTSSFQYVSTPYHGSTLTLQPETFASSFSLRSIKSGKASEPEVHKPKLFDIRILLNPVYLIILISNATNAISYTNFIILLPSYAKDLQFTKDDGAMLLSILSAWDLVGRIGGSALSDMTMFPKCWYFVGGLFLSGISLSLIPIFYDFWTIAALCSIFGLASGTYVGITAIVMADMLGEDKLQSTYGMGLFVNGIIQLVGPPICGYWSERAQSYVSLFTFLGLTLTAGSLLWAIVPCLNKKSESDKDAVDNTSP